jgi:drug/metabolite transporter (DMT)-like permease
VHAAERIRIVPAVGVTIVLGVLCAICWGLPDVNLARAARNVGPLAVVVGALVLGTAAVLPGLLFVDLPEWSTRGALLAAAAGAAMTFGYWLGYTGFLHGNVSLVAPIIACEGGVAAAISLAAGDDVPLAILLFLPVAVVGVVLAAMGSGGGGRAGAAYASGAALLWGVVLVLSAPVADEFGVLVGFLMVRAFALVVVLPFALAARRATAWTGDFWNVAAWALGDAFAYLLFIAAADRGPVAVASVLAAQFATVGVIAGVVLLHERLRPRQWVGIAMVLVAVTAIALLAE